MAVHLPNEVISEIIQNLSLRSLICCRLVSKSWMKIVDGVRSTRTLKKSAFIFLSTGPTGASYIVEEDVEHKSVRRFKATKLSRSHQHNMSSMLRSNPCPHGSGLLYITRGGYFSYKSKFDSHSYISNPAATSDPLKLPLLTPHSNSTSCCITPGFGFDPTSKRFKAVQIIFCLETFGTLIEAYVYTLCLNPNRNHGFLPDLIPADGGSWRKLDNVPQVRCSGSSVQVNASLHWFSNCKRQILSFDLSTEKFSFIEPPQVPNSSYQDLTLVALKGCLAIYSSYSGFAEIWIMTDYTKDPWTEFKFKYFMDLNPPLGFPISGFKNGEVLVLSGNKNILCLNVETGKVSHYATVRGIPYNGQYCVYPYTGDTRYHQYSYLMNQGTVNRKRKTGYNT